MKGFFFFGLTHGVIKWILWVFLKFVGADLGCLLASVNGCKLSLSEQSENDKQANVSIPTIDTKKTTENNYNYTQPKHAA